MRRVAVITGAAGGIGAELAKAYLKADYHVAITDKEEARLQSLNKRLAAEFGSDRLYAAAADLASEHQVAAMIQEAWNVFGRLDVLINNAGFGITKSMFELTVDEWDSVLHCNLRGAFLCGREAAARMKQQPEGGSIIHIASTRAIMSEPDSEAYAASKGGLVALTHAMAASLAKHRITVNCISPGWIETGDYSQLRETDHRQHLSGRVGQPEDIARACLYLSEGRNDFVNGINLVIDGGMTHKMIYEE